MPYYTFKFGKYAQYNVGGGRNGVTVQSPNKAEARKKLFEMCQQGVNGLNTKHYEKWMKNFGQVLEDERGNNEY